MTIKMTARQLASLGGHGKGRKVIKKKSGRKPSRPAPVVELVEPETVICEGEIFGRAVPWKAPSLGRNGGVNYSGRDYQAFTAWKESIKRQAAVLMRRTRPYGGPVRLYATFYLAPTPEPHIPDRTNLLKAFEDGLQGVVYPNDRWVCGGPGDRVISATERERVEFRVVAV